MELVNIEIKVPKEMKQYIITKDDSAEIKRNALMLYPYIQDKTISYGKAKTLASDFVTGSPYENIMGKVVSVDRGPWKSKIGVNSDRFGKYIGNGSESTVFMANDDPNFVYKILTANVPTP